MALSMKKKRSFAHSQQFCAKMCFQDQNIKNMTDSPVSWPIPMRAIGAQNLLTMPGGVTISGYLHKKGGSQFSLMKWPLRFIIIHKGCIYYFKSSTSAAPQGAFSLSGYNRVLRAAEETTSGNVFPFKIVHFSKRHRTWYFSAASEDERKKWMRNLRKEIDHYNGKRKSDIPSNDLDDYIPIEETLEINESDNEDEPDYEVQDEDSNEEDVEHNGSSELPGRLPVPPPPYPPPPVPDLPRYSRHIKGPLPPLPPPFKKPSSCSTKNNGPPPLPPAPHLKKPDMHQPTKGPMSPMPPPPPLTSTKPSLGTFSTMPICEKKPNTSVMGNNLLIIENLQKVLLNAENKPPIPSHHLGGRSTPDHRTVSPHLSTALSHEPSGQILKPPVPTKPRRPSLQRASPDGQSFRSSVEENPLKKRAQGRNSEDSDDDYENVQLPPSVFVDMTETSSVERLFKETYFPQNGLYCIRKSGTGKTSQVLVVWDTGINKARNYRLFEEEQRVYLETDITFPSLAALVEHYYIHPLPSSTNSLPNYSLCLNVPYGYNTPR
ncbi:SH3 domain-binding protein 2-like isoform X1 [Myxocyprinus asiaticus]|uniref:SH3 domain-binding protein 2-like isoform X1 n=1 Tax=Myxocyprinus asiaticus TaxID=70543 RepID=UPI002221BA97|nr:SH3 domain-binding protein 2-like isoform X1 [Myxocyprinus asiaticus]